LAAKALRRQLHVLQELNGNRMDRAFGVAAGAEAAKPPTSPVVDETLREDAAGGIAGAEKENVVGSIRHKWCVRVENNQGRLVAMQSPDCGPRERNCAPA